MKHIWIACLLLLAGVAHAQDYRIERDIPYRSSDAPAAQRCRLDIAYKPGTRHRPVIVWFHGGGLTGGERSIPRELLASDYVVVGAGYRLAPETSVPEIVDDAAAAVAWVFRHAAEYGGDPSKIYVAGHSAGGYLADMIGLDRRYLHRYGVEADSIAAIVPYSGQAITHFTHRSMQGLGPLQPTVDSLAPLYHVRGDAPSMLILSGDREEELYGRYEETAYFRRMLLLAGHRDVEFHEFEGFDHNDMCAPGHAILMKYIRRRQEPVTRP